MNFASLFTGIGGLDLGLERAGMTVIWQSEIDPYACRVLAKHWPNVPNLGDVTAIDWTAVERPDLICGGFPCQPFSVAGARRGADDDRYLWPYFADAVRVVRPRWALLENVPGLITAGFGSVLADLAALGYDVEWECIPAAAVGAPHLRWRIFAVATDAERDGLRHEPVADAGRDGAARPVADAGRGRCSIFGLAELAGLVGAPRRIADRCGADREQLDAAMADAECDRWERPAPPRSARPCGRRPGGVGSKVAITEGQRRGPFGSQDAGETRSDDVARHAGQWFGGNAWAAEPDVGRVANGVPARVDRLRCLGNAVVPQVAEWIGRQIMDAAEDGK